MSNWKTSINELILIFNDALKALVPIAQRAQMKWKEPENYDDWDEICTALYRSIVAQSINHASEAKKFNALVNYDTRLSSYANSSYISTSDSEGSQALIGFRTLVTPFDSGEFAVLDKNGIVITMKNSLLADIQLTLANRNQQDVSLVEEINVAI